MKTKFYSLLYKDDAFCCALGRVMLSASKLEIKLRQYLRIVGKDIPEKEATLGNLIRHLRKNDLLTKNGKIHFGQISLQRNYLIHNLYGSFINEIEHALLPVEDLVPLDKELYTDRARETAKNFEIYSKIVDKVIDQIKIKKLSGSEIKPLL